MVVLIDPSDPELFTLVKSIVDSGYENVEAENYVLCKMLEERGRKVKIDFISEGNIHITFPKKKRFGIF